MPRTAKKDADPFNTQTPVDTNGHAETKNDKFRRIAKKRVTRVLKEADLLGNLSSPAYQFSEEEVEKVFGAIKDSFERAEAGFIRALSRGHKAVAGFDF